MFESFLGNTLGEFFAIPISGNVVGIASDNSFKNAFSIFFEKFIQAFLWELSQSFLYKILQQCLWEFVQHLLFLPVIPSANSFWISHATGMDTSLCFFYQNLQNCIGCSKETTDGISEGIGANIFKWNIFITRAICDGIYRRIVTWISEKKKSRKTQMESQRIFLMDFGRNSQKILEEIRKVIL